jgi:acyl-coenzyme A synthetase/AMP-(fatty) acid ligase
LTKALLLWLHRWIFVAFAIPLAVDVDTFLQRGAELAARAKGLSTVFTLGRAAPKHVKFVTDLPMTGVGKVDKKALKASFWAGRERMVG